MHTDPQEIRQRINERLQIMANCGTGYSNDQNTKPGGFPLVRFMWALVIVAIVAALRGW